MKIEKVLNGGFKLLNKICLILAVILIIGAMLLYSYASDLPKLSLLYKNKIEIGISKSRNDMNITNFKEDVYSELENLGVDRDLVIFSETEREYTSTNATDAATIFNSWGRIGFTGQWYLEDSTIINKENTDNLTGFYNNTKFDYEDITLEYDNTSPNGDDDGMGGMIRLNINEDGTVSTYIFLMFGSSGAWPYNRSGLYKISNNSFSYTNLELLVGIDNYWQRNTWTNYIIDAKGNNIKVYLDNSLLIDYTDENNPINSGTYGFFSISQPYATFKNVQIESVSYKSFEETLRNTTFSDSSLHAMINITDREEEELNNPNFRASVLSRTINERIHYIGLGTSENKQQIEDFVAQNNNKGIYIDNTNYNNAVRETAEYIKTLLETYQGDDIYLILGDSTQTQIEPAEIKNNTQSINYPNGKWKIMHDYNYFENNNGQYNNSGKYIPDLPDQFNKIGKYEILYADVNIDPQYIYVHRRPEALISVQRNGTNVVLTSEKSFDLDKKSLNNGISEEEWSYKRPTETDWTQGKITSIEQDDVYIIQLRVKDYQDTWSYETTKYITSDLTSIPVASFRAVNPTISKYEELEIRDSSYDPAGGEITSYNWEYYFNNTLIYSGGTPKTTFANDSIGEYTIYLTVTNDRGSTSERFSKKVSITDDEYAPEVVITPVSSEWNTSQMVHLEFSDRGGSGLKYYKFAITEDTNTPTQWSENIENYSGDIEISGNGLKYLHIISEDNAGNISEDRIAGPFCVDNTKPQITVSGDLETHVLNTLVLHIAATDSLSGIRTVNIDGISISENTDYQFTKNGTYTITAEDNVGNVKTQTITINNIYYSCTKNIGHPDFLSTHDKCPICESYEGLTITQDTKTYNGNSQSISYDNPKNATIVEYYNLITTKPVNADSYEYSLKVVYNGVEYNTGLDGIFTINKKNLTIEGVDALDKIYDANDIVQITGGTLVGIISGDIVEPIVPTTGVSESADVGTHKVSIEDITLTGEQASNYTLTQIPYGDIDVTIFKATSPLVIKCDNKVYDGDVIVPEKVSGLNTSPVTYTFYEHNSNISITAPKNAGEYDVIAYQISDSNYDSIYSDKITFTISPKQLTIKDVDAIDRPYDATNIVRITGGELVGVVSGDSVFPTVHTFGISESANVGTHRVEIDDITLTGEQASNYTLTQIPYGDIDVVISPKELTIKGVDAINKTYDTSDIVQITRGTLVGVLPGDMVIPIVPETGISESANVGTHRVEIEDITLTGVHASNYILTQIPYGDIDVVISPKKLTIEGVDAVNKIYDANDIVQITGGNLVGVFEGDTVEPIVPETGVSESENAGTHSVAIEDITLTGEHASNYTLTQIEYGEIDVVISKREITIEDVDAVDKIYDTSDIVQITGGNLVGVFEGDTVEPIVPETGISESENAGTHSVAIEDITLTGEQASNYILTQIPYGDIDVVISKDISQLIIKCDSKVYDGKIITPEKISGLNTSEVIYTYFERNSDTPISAPKNVGEYYIIASQEETDNYYGVTTEKIEFKITPKELIIKDIKAKEKEYDGNNTIYLSGGKLLGIINNDDVNFILPETGSSEKESVGTWNVKISEIVLTGKDKANYTLTQPKLSDVKVKISQQAPTPIPQTGENKTIIIAIVLSTLLTTLLGAKFIFKFKTK